MGDLPKDPLLPIDNTFAKSITSNLPTSTPNIPSHIPVPSSSYTLKYPDKTFEASEQKVDKTAQHTSSHFEKSQKRILRRLGGMIRWG